jgi:hypothetical protein
MCLLKEICIEVNSSVPITLVTQVYTQLHEIGGSGGITVLYLEALGI